MAGVYYYEDRFFIALNVEGSGMISLLALKMLNVFISFPLSLFQTSVSIHTDDPIQSLPTPLSSLLPTTVSKLTHRCYSQNIESVRVLRLYLQSLLYWPEAELLC